MQKLKAKQLAAYLLFANRGHNESYRLEHSAYLLSQLVDSLNFNAKLKAKQLAAYLLSQTE